MRRSKAHQQFPRLEMKRLEGRRLSSRKWSNHMQQKRRYSYHVQEVRCCCHAFSSTPRSVNARLAARRCTSPLGPLRLLSECKNSYKLQEDLPLWIASASLSGISMLNSSSIAITTSTVSRLSRPRSFVKWAFPLI